jgi:putative ABC transport system permease protein
VAVQDLRHALRVSRKDALFTTAVVGVLGLGIGSPTLVFSVVNAVLLRPLPYPEADRLVAVEEHAPLQQAGRGMGVAFPNHLDIRARARLLEDVFAYTEGNATLRGQGAPEVVRAGFVTDGAFGVLRVAPILGRTFTREEDLAEGPRAIILGEELWRRLYGSDAAVLGRVIQVGTDLLN